MASIDSRLAALALAIQRRQMEQDAPVDALSHSMMECADWLAGLDKLGKAALLEEMNKPSENGPGLDLTLEDINRMIADWR